MMTHFLEVGAIRDGLQEVREHALWLRRLMSMTSEQRDAADQSRLQQGEMTTVADDIRTAVKSIVQEAEALVSFLDQFESAPIVYTGEGSTAEVLGMLERLMQKAEAATDTP